MSSEDPRAQVRLAAGWAVGTFRRNLLAFVALAAIVAAVQFLQQLSLQPLNDVLVQCSDPQTPGQQAACAEQLASRTLLSALLTLFFAIVTIVVSVGVIRAALRATRGQEAGFDALLDGHNLGRYLLFQIVYAFMAGFGILLCILPGLLVIFFFQLGPYYVLDRGMKVGEALVASARVIRQNLAAAFLMTVFNALVLLIGGLFYGILTLVALPLATLFTAHLYRQFNDESVV